MDSALIRRLRTLPVDLVPLGWELVPAHPYPSRRASGPSYRVVYERPFEPETDDRFAGVVLDSGRYYVEARSSEPWDDA